MDMCRSLLGLAAFGLLLWAGLLQAASDPPANGKTYWIVGSDSGLCLKSNGLNSSLVQSACLADENYQWTLVANGNGSVSLQAKSNGLCLDVQFALPQSGAGVVSFNCSKAPNQSWRLSQESDGFALIAAHSGKCLGVGGDSLREAATVGQWDCTDAGSDRFYLKEVVADPARVGQWSAILPMSTVPVAAAALPNGKILYWSSWDKLDFVLGTGDSNKTYTGIFDPATQSDVGYLITNTHHDMFCPGTAMLADGRVHVAGGGDSILASYTTSIYDYRANAWTRDADMHQGRWYNSSVTLPDGGVLTLGGNLHAQPFPQQAHYDGSGEVWHADQGWRSAPGLVMTPLLGSGTGNRGEEHPKMSIAPNGKVLIAGPTPNMQWYDPAANGGNGAIAPAGVRHGDAFAQTGIFVQYNDHQIVKAAGNANYDGPDAENNRSLNSAYVIDLNTGQARAIEPLTFPRASGNGVVLPDGKVIVFGGLNNGKNFTDDGSIMHPEMFDPATERWSLLAPMNVPRNYHSVALLMPDGRIYAGGGGLCGIRCPAAYNHADAQLYSPPYLFKGPRPSIDAAPDVLGYNQAFTISASGGVARATFIRMSSVTHAVNTDQRFMELPGRASGGNGYALLSPANANLAPPGYYMLFVLNGQGVPSLAKIILLKSPAVPLSAAPSAAAAQASKVDDGIDPHRDYAISSASGQRCLGFAPIGAGDRATLAGQACLGQAARFAFVPVYPGYYRIKLQQSGLCLAAGGAPTDSGAAVAAAICKDSDTQHWHPIQRADGRFAFMSRHSHQLLELDGCAAMSGAQRLQQRRDDGSACQSFKLD